ncbi:hypothetical protein ANCDUO_04364 [Ancylostoma duodenale]|uniref:Uncharacterized protein n=1 Tax=Ancylostoma duodenale TaxID=51022 RepID=A0A0C2H175_9BILA|nr:hypothetical protein ANCDUO_04364 [Ancylostoma duodenale]
MTTALLRNFHMSSPLTGTKSESSSSVQLISQTSGEVSIGDVDREVLTDSIVKCCALDLIDPDIFTVSFVFSTE